MKKLLYIDLEFHIKTASSKFLYELLEENFLVDKCFLDLDGRIYGIPIDQIAQHYDYLVLLQVMPARKHIEIFSYGKGILFPMYDSVLNRTIEHWMEYKDFTIINFSKTLHDYLSEKGFQSRYIQFFPQPKEIKDYGSIDTLFFWQRTNQIHTNQVLSLCKNLNLKKVHIHKALDPTSYYIDVDERFHYDFTYSRWFSEKQDLLKVISGAAYYAAPRRYEGIGMSFLEAMAMGRCVIAPDYPTMNEYIKDGVNGILYDYDNPVDIPECDVRKLQENAYLSVEIGYKRWLIEKYHIIEWMEENRDGKKMPILRPANELTETRMSIQGDKYYSYYVFMNRWMLLKNRKISLNVWFESKSVHHIAVYGYSEMAARVAEELKGTDICVDCYLDKEKKWTDDGRRTITMEEFLPSVDMVVVTSFFYFQEIKEMFAKRFSFKVISLEEIINDLLKEL